VNDEEETVHLWDDSDEGAEMKAYFEWVSAWDTRNVAAAIENTTKWFRKPISPVVIEELYKNNVKASSDPSKYSPTFRTKIPTTKDANETPTSEFFGAKKEVITMNQVVQGSKVIALMKITGLWFAGKSFGMNFTLIQLVQMGSEKFKGCAISIPMQPSYGGHAQDGGFGGCRVDDNIQYKRNNNPAPAADNDENGTKRLKIEDENGSYGQ
jgi:hypothetical protein